MLRLIACLAMPKRVTLLLTDALLFLIVLALGLHIHANLRAILYVSAVFHG